MQTSFLWKDFIYVHIKGKLLLPRRDERKLNQIWHSLLEITRRKKHVLSDNFTFSLHAVIPTFLECTCFLGMPGHGHEFEGTILEAGKKEWITNQEKSHSFIKNFSSLLSNFISKKSTHNSSLQCLCNSIAAVGIKKKKSNPLDKCLPPFLSSNPYGPRWQGVHIDL